MTASFGGFLKPPETRGGTGFITSDVIRGHLGQGGTSLGLVRVTAHILRDPNGGAKRAFPFNPPQTSAVFAWKSLFLRTLKGLLSNIKAFALIQSKCPTVPAKNQAGMEE